MNSEATKFLADWERMRRQSRRAYVTKYGVFGWGIPAGLSIGAGRWVFQPESITVGIIIGHAVSGAVLGMVYGLYHWDKYETRYRSLAERGSGTNPTSLG